jgi:hypothetical protein
MAAVAALESLSLDDSQLLTAADDLLVDMLNDEMPSVRLRTAQALVSLAGELSDDLIDKAIIRVVSC